MVAASTTGLDLRSVLSSMAASEIDGGPSAVHCAFARASCVLRPIDRANLNSFETLMIANSYRA